MKHKRGMTLYIDFGFFLLSMASLGQSFYDLTGPEPSSRHWYSPVSNRIWRMSNTRFGGHPISRRADVLTGLFYLQRGGYVLTLKHEMMATTTIDLRYDVDISWGTHLSNLILPVTIMNILVKQLRKGSQASIWSTVAPNLIHYTTSKSVLQRNPWYRNSRKAVFFLDGYLTTIF